MKSKPTWILIADGGHAAVFESLGARSKLTPVEGMAFNMELPPNREIESDRPGRSQESANPTRHAIESRVDPHRELKRQLARKVALKLEAAARNGKFDRLAVVAAPEVLGELRAAFSDSLKSLVIAELAKDLVKIPLAELPSHLEAIW
jgi:protein required for attachment to host cells